MVDHFDVLQEELLGDPIEDARVLVEVLAQIQPLARTNLMNKRKVLDLMQEKVPETAENAVSTPSAAIQSAVTRTAARWLAMSASRSRAS